MNPEKIYVEDYSEKSFVVYGNTKEYKEEIKNLGGKWNSNLRNEKVGWIFSKSKKDKVLSYLDDKKIPYLVKSDLSDDEMLDETPSAINKIDLLLITVNILKNKVKDLEEKYEKLHSRMEEENNDLQRIVN